jgi:methyl-accepting chemotaxis protein
MSKMNFRNTLLATLIPTVFIAISALTILSYATFSDLLLAQGRMSLKRISEQSAKELDSWLSDRKREAYIFSEINVFRAACRGNRMAEAKKRLETYHRASPVFENLFLADVDGRLFLDSIEGKSIGIDLGQLPVSRPNYEAALAGEIRISNAFPSPASGRPVALITAPIHEGEQIVGIMGAPIEIVYFSDLFIGDYRIGETGYLYMLDANGVAIAHPNDAYVFDVDLAEYDFGKEMVDTGSGFISYTWEGVEKLQHYLRSSETGWIVSAVQNEEELLSPVENFRNLLIIFGLIIIGLFSLIVWSVSARLFRVINRSVAGLKDGGEGITAASAQLSSASQSLAEGVSEQAASIQETSSSLEEMAAITRQNADHAGNADTDMKSALSLVDEANTAIGALSTAMAEIRASGEQTSSIVQTIDGIAFQTNLLALNAAVEAARAGEVGAGFAVVADEVRNLSMKAAEAAKNTASILEETGRRIGDGVDRLSETDKTFVRLKETIGACADRVDEIASASDQQARGIEQVNAAVVEMDSVVQKNAANAQESASASEEMHARAGQITEIIEQLATLVRGRGKGAGDRRRNTGPGGDDHLRPEAPRQERLADHRPAGPMLPEK